MKHEFSSLDPLIRQKEDIYKARCLWVSKVAPRNHAFNTWRRIFLSMKLESLSLQYESYDADILVEDLRFWKKVPQGGLKTKCRTPAFVAPDIKLICGQLESCCFFFLVDILLSKTRIIMILSQHLCNRLYLPWVVLETYIYWRKTTNISTFDCKSK